MSTETITNVETTPVQENIQPQTAVEETPEQINWRKFRQERAVERKAKEESDRKAAEKEAEATALKAAMEALLNKNQQPQQHSYDPQEETEEDRIQKKIDTALANRERQWEEDRRRREHQEFPQKLVSTFKDFNEVCTTENLDYMEYHYPEVAAAFKQAPDSYDKWASVYQAVKRFVPNNKDSKDKRKAEANNVKPQSMSVPGVTQTGDTAPIQLDEKRRSDNWQRMQRVMRGGK